MEERQEHKASRVYVLYAPRTLQLIFFSSFSFHPFGFTLLL
jgi:hypothetical protein